MGNRKFKRYILGNWRVRNGIERAWKRIFRFKIIRESPFPLLQNFPDIVGRLQTSLFWRFVGKLPRYRLLGSCGKSFAIRLNGSVLEVSPRRCSRWSNHQRRCRKSDVVENLTNGLRFEHRGDDLDVAAAMATLNIDLENTLE